MNRFIVSSNPADAKAALIELTHGPKPSTVSKRCVSRCYQIIETCGENGGSCNVIKVLNVEQ